MVAEKASQFEFIKTFDSQLNKEDRPADADGLLYMHAMMTLSDSDFSIFNLPLRFELNEANLDAAYLRLQSQTHPDRFSQASAQEKRLAVQCSTRINEAYRRLKNPLERAIYWCELQGVNPRAQQSNLPQTLLIQQIEWRENLEEAHHVSQIETLIDVVVKEKHLRFNQIAQQIDIRGDAQAAAQTTQALLFIDKFLLELNKKLEQLEDAI